MHPRGELDRESRPKPIWWGLGRDLVIGTTVGVAVGAFFSDVVFGASAGAAVGFLLHLYFRLRTH